MVTARESGLAPEALSNSPAAIQERVKSGRISWAGPLLLVSARSFLLMAAQGLVALILLALHRPSPWRMAGDWWGVYGTLIDIGCLIGLCYFTHREGIQIRDLLGPIRMCRGHDLLLGLGYYLLVFPFFLGGNYVARILLYGSNVSTLNSYLVR